MPILAPLVAETTTTTGTGDVTLTGRTGEGWRTFNGAYGTGGTDLFHYWIRHRTALEWEFGSGHLSAATTLVRDTVIRSSNSDAAVSFAAGTKDVYCDTASGPAAFSRLKVGATVYNSLPGVSPVTGAPVQVAALAAGTTYYMPIRIEDAGAGPVLDSLTVEVTTAGGAGTLARIGICVASPDLAPGALIFGSAALAVDSTGLKTAGSIATRLTPGYYHLILVSDGTPSVRVIRGSLAVMPIRVNGTANMLFESLRNTSAGYSALPDPAAAVETDGFGGTGMNYTVFPGFTP